MDRWMKIGCPGPEDGQMISFIDSSLSGINPENDNAIKWRKLIGLSLFLKKEKLNLGMKNYLIEVIVILY